MPYSFSNRIARQALLCFAALGGAALFLLCPSSVWAQSGGGVDSTGTGGIHSIQGRIYFPSGRRSDMRVMVKLQSYNSGELSVLSDANGGFTFKGLIPGSYTVVVDGGNDYETVRDSVYVETDGMCDAYHLVEVRVEAEQFVCAVCGLDLDSELLSQTFLARFSCINRASHER